MRIVGGAWRGRTLASPGKLKGVRPTADRVREALFSILASRGAPIDGAHVLDLFAGTGALGLEALSRGADKATFVETSAPVRAILTRNIAGFEDALTTVIARSATQLPPNPGAACNIIFADPPYGKGLGEKALSSALKGGWIAPGAWIIWEENTDVTWPDGLTEIDSRIYGDTRIHFGEADT